MGCVRPQSLCFHLSDTNIKTITALVFCQQKSARISNFFYYIAKEHLSSLFERSYKHIVHKTPISLAEFVPRFALITPKVFHKGNYTINIGQEPSHKSLPGIKAMDPNDNRTLTVTF